MKTQATSKPQVMSKPAARDRAVRTPGGLSVRLDVRAFTVVALLLVAALTAGVVLIGTGDFPIPVEATS